jgi:hypothetical protein
MTLHYLQERQLSEKARELIQFDMDSIRQIVSGQRLPAPDIWLVDPDQYEQNGRLLRDSTTSRLIAYSTESKMFYASDGCNACEGKSDIPAAMLERLHALISGHSISG